MLHLREHNYLKIKHKFLGVAVWNRTGLAGVAIFVAMLFAAPAPASDIYVIDGDTIVIDLEHIRIANIDAPEILHYKCATELELGERARARMEVLMGSGNVSVIRGDHGRMKDRYGRSLGRVLVDGKDVGETLITEGLARAWDGHRHPWCR
jgi:micrococcal nuclease